jgi:hypothetical protein
VRDGEQRRSWASRLGRGHTGLGIFFSSSSCFPCVFSHFFLFLFFGLFPCPAVMDRRLEAVWPNVIWVLLMLCGLVVMIFGVWWLIVDRYGEGKPWLWSDELMALWWAVKRWWWWCEEGNMATGLERRGCCDAVWIWGMDEWETKMQVWVIGCEIG